MKKHNLARKPLLVAMGLAMSGLSMSAMAETITGVAAPVYDPNPMGQYYATAGGYAGAKYNYAVGFNSITRTGTNYAAVFNYGSGSGCGEAGDIWSVRGDEHLMNDPMIAGHTFKGVGALSWCQAGACAGAGGTSSGWNHTAQHVLFAVTTAADIKITLSNAASVEGVDGPNETNTGALGNDLIPGFTLFDGVSDQGWNGVSHTYVNTQNYTPEPNVGIKGTIVPAVAPDLIYRAHDANVANANSISQTYNLPVGLYSIWFGGNIANTPNQNSDLICTTSSGGNCTGFGGTGKNFQLTIETAPATVPVPAAAWLFGGALSALGALGRRRKVAG